jgi:hypothetical protein
MGGGRRPNVSITEPARDVPIVGEYDVCVLGGSCTGVFAAVRAARLGARVAVVEKQNAFGGVATNGLVNIWHSIYDTTFDRQIIAGLTQEMVDRLLKRDACIERERSNSAGFILNTEELKIELDELVREHNITPHLHTVFAAPHVVDGRIEAVFIENKNGRGAIRAGVFIDATGDGDLAARCGLPFRFAAHIQPPTTCAKIRGLGGLNIREFWNQHREEFGMPADAGWGCDIPNGGDVRMHAETHVFETNSAVAEELTFAEMEGRRQIRALMDMVRKYAPERREQLGLLDLGAIIGIRESRRFDAAYALTEEDVLEGRRFEDAIAQGSYRVDVHHPSGGGFLFKYLDGTQVSITSAGREHGRWREARDEDPTFYQIPYRTMVHADAPNLIMAGRMIAADQPAFGAIRVMVNLNQTGEAAGVAAAIATQENLATVDVPATELRQKLAAGGSIVI